MKRTPIYNSYNPTSSPPRSSYYKERNEFNYESKTVYKSNGRESPEWNPNEMIKMSEKYGNDDSWNEKQNNNRIQKERITTEIAPGLVVQGYVAEL